MKTAEDKQLDIKEFYEYVLLQVSEYFKAKMMTTCRTVKLQTQKWTKPKKLLCFAEATETAYLSL